ncbi:BTB POZ domain-containing POB1 [Paramuricea clavata]|uniref:BTB POZ domain-containing POB1 n=1 Tax=Paramuricea clavata TaxID=317549 RepID=A0A7D9LCJ3_PARCT|nr:BTB POZ domain-containing POB1 [Paramuricea clavata]
MSDMELKYCDLIDFSKMCVPEYNMPEFSDRVLVFDVMRDEWETASLVQSSANTAEPGVSHSGDSIETSGDLIETSGSKRSLEIADEGPEQKRRKKIEPNNETRVELLVADSGSETEPTCEQINADCEIEIGSAMENKSHEPACEQAENKKLDKPSTSPLHPSTEGVPEKAAILDCNGIQENLNESLRQHKIYVHGLWLAVQSPYFRSLLHSSGMKETHDTEVHLKIPESEEKAHLVLLEAMYCSDVLNDKSVDELLDVLELADKYDVKFAFKKCKYVLQQNATTFEISRKIMHVIKVKHNMNDSEDLAVTLQLVLAQEFSPLDENWQSEKFTSLPEPSVKYLLRSDDLIVQSENTVFHALMHWMEQNDVDPAGLEETNDLLAAVRFKLVTIDYLYNVIKNHPIALKMPKFSELYLGGMTHHAIPVEQKSLLEEPPVLRKEHKGNIIQHTFVVKKEDYAETSSGGAVELISDEFWACGYKMSVHLSICCSSYSFHYSDLSMSVHNLNKESLVPLKFAFLKNGTTMSLQEKTFNQKQLSCAERCRNLKLQSSDFSNDDTCKLCIVVEVS